MNRQRREWLIAKRAKQSLMQSDVAEKCGISQASYCNIEQGKRKPTVSNAKRIAELLGFEWTMFFE